MTTVRARGNTSVRERPDSPEWDFGTEKIRCTRTYEGMYPDILAGRPLVGLAQEGFDGLLVGNVKIRKAVSGKATMTVVLEVSVLTADYSTVEPFQPVYEIEWASIERIIEKNDTFRHLFGVPSSLTQITANYNAMQAWENAADSAAKQAAFTALKSTDSTGLLQQLAACKMAGETTFMLFNPVARITSQSRQVMRVAPCGIISATVPGFGDALPTGYQWLSTADRCTRTGTDGKWQRSQEWTGAEYWDARSYHAPGAGISGPNTPSS